MSILFRKNIQENMIRSLLFASIALFHFCQSAPTGVEKFDLTLHLQEIASLIPKDLIRNITYEHLRTDEEFKAAVKFMQSDIWTERIKIIKEKPEWQELKAYMKDFGINVDVFIKCVDGFIQNITVELDADHPPSKKSVKAFLIDVEQNLPTMKILTAVHEMMIQNEKFQQLFLKISSPDTRKMVDDVLALPEIKCMIKDLADMDLNVADAISLAYLFLGWGERNVSAM